MAWRSASEAPRTVLRGKTVTDEEKPPVTRHAGRQGQTRNARQRAVIQEIRNYGTRRLPLPRPRKDAAGGGAPGSSKLPKRYSSVTTYERLG